MHGKFFKDKAVQYKTYHPENYGFSETLKYLRLKSSGEIQSHAVISLSYTVQSHLVDKQNMTWSDSCTKMGYIRPNSMVENWAIKQNKNRFEVLCTKAH